MGRHHEKVGKLVKGCLKRGIGLEDLSVADLEQEFPSEGAILHQCLSPEYSVAMRESYGGPGPKAFESQLLQAQKLLDQADFPVWV